MAPIFRRALEPHPRPETTRLLECTLEVLRETYDLLANSVASGVDPAIYREGQAQIERIAALRSELAGPGAPSALDRPERSNWERFQIANANVRYLERLGARALDAETQRDRFAAADAAYQELIAEQMQADERVMAVPMLYANHSKLLRRLGAGRLSDPAGRELMSRALQQAANGVLREPLNPRVRREVGKDHFALEQYADALAVWLETQHLTPNDPHLAFKIGLCHWYLARDRSRRDERVAELELAHASFETAWVLFGLENLEQRTWAQLWRGRAALELDRLDAAMIDLRSAANLNGSHLAAKLLLGECYRRAGDEAMSFSCFAEVSAALGADAAGALDHDWGDTLTRCEAVAWAGWGEATSAAAPPDTARLPIIERALEAARGIPAERSRAHWTARCLDAKGHLQARADLKQALVAVQQADALIASPEIILHLLELYEAQAKKLADHEQRLEVVHQAEQAVRRLKRLDLNDEHSYAAQAGEIMARLQALRDAPAPNGHGRWPPFARRRATAPVA